MCIQLKDLSFAYGKGRQKALDMVTARIEPGLYLLLGPNGAGKTTLLHAMCGALRVDAGQCLLDGENPQSHSPQVMQKIAFAGVNASMPQSSIRDMVKRHGVLYPTFSAQTLNACLEAFGVKAEDKFKSMSAGTLQKTTVSYALALHTSFLFLDEPMATMDIESKDKILKLLAEHMHHGQTVIVSTHNIADMGNMFDGVAIMRKGRLLTLTDVDKVVERLSFVDGVQPGPGALYTHFEAGVWHSVMERTPQGQQTRANWRLLYMALQQDDNSKILEILNR